MQHNEYNGYYNYETWNIKLWIDNDQALSEMLSEAARDYIDQCDTDNEDPRTFGETLESLFTDPELGLGLFPELPAGPASDAINLYKCEINWEEIAEHALDDARDQIRYENQSGR